MREIKTISVLVDAIPRVEEMDESNKAGMNYIKFKTQIV
jgi:hypothetical protein